MTPNAPANAGLHVGPQRRDGTVDVKGTLTPEAWAIYEAIFAKTAAPGMCNPDDEHPCLSGTPSQEQIDNDHRSLAQRQHDALIAIGRNALRIRRTGSAQRITDLDHHPHHPARPREPRRGRRHRRRHPACRSTTSSAWPATPTTGWRSSTRPPDRHWTCSAPNAWPPRPSGSCSSPATAAAPNPAAPCPPTAARSTTRCATGPTAATPTSTTGPGVWTRQPPRRQRRLDHHHQHPRRRRMDPPTPTRHRPNPRQLLPPPRTTPTPTRPTRRKPRTRTVETHRVQCLDVGRGSHMVVHSR